VRVGDFVEPAVANESPVWHRQVRALGDDRLLHLHHLRHVIAARPERLDPDSFVNTGEHFRVEVVAVVDLAQVPDKVFEFHPFFRLKYEFSGYSAKNT